MRVAELLKIIKADGWRFERHGKRHDVYSHPTKKGALQIERHAKEVAKGTLDKLLKDAGLK